MQQQQQQQAVTTVPSTIKAIPTERLTASVKEDLTVDMSEAKARTIIEAMYHEK